jgi:hypothetical protein
MKQKIATIMATFALGFLLAAPAGAGPDKNGGGGAPPGYGGDWGGPTDNCGNCGGGHNKNGGGGHNKNGGGGNVGGRGGNANDLLCYVGGRAVYVASRRECRRLVYNYSYGGDYNAGHGGGYGHGHGYNDGYGVSRATRMQMRKRAAAGYVSNGGHRVHKRKLRRHAARRGHGGKQIIVNNYGGVVQINKGGAY